MNEQSEIKTITHDEYLKLLGLGVLAAELQKKLIDLGYAVQSIVKEVPSKMTGSSDFGPAYDGGHVSDFVNDRQPDASALLRKLGIKVLTRSVFVPKGAAPKEG